MTRIYLARHGETEWNLRGKLQGHTDMPLNASGKAQAAALAATLGELGITHVTTSDLGRARETGSIVARALGLEAPGVDEGFRERCFGVFEGLTRDECAAQHPEAWKAWLEQTSPPVGAEPVDDAVARMTAALTRTHARVAVDGSALVVSHGGVMRLWLKSITETPIPLIGNGAVYVVERSADDASFTASPLLRPA